MEKKILENLIEAVGNAWLMKLGIIRTAVQVFLGVVLALLIFVSVQVGRVIQFMLT